MLQVLFSLAHCELTKRRCHISWLDLYTIRPEQPKETLSQRREPGGEVDKTACRLESNELSAGVSCNLAAIIQAPREK
jgi:hypothetical protein